MTFMKGMYSSRKGGKKNWPLPLTKEQTQVLDDLNVLPDKVNGCVCGVEHESDTFCVQCNDCREWYNIVQGCSHASQDEASGNDFIWKCRRCDPESDDVGSDDNADDELVFTED